MAVTVFGAVQGLANPGPYDALPLRADLCSEDCFRTAAGRELKRGADAPVNQYRLYDFYRRQADQELANQGTPRLLLPPYPGLDGGRRGHWGDTNSKQSSAYPREVASGFGLVTSAGGTGEWLVSGPHGVVGIDSLGGGLVRAVAAGKLGRPEHPFGTKVDRLGFDVMVEGASMFERNVPEWTSGGKACMIAGYRLLASGAAIEWTDGSNGWLERPQMAMAGKTCVLLRDFRFHDPMSAGLSFRLPGPEEGSWTFTTGPNAISARCDREGTVILHRIEPDPPLLWKTDAGRSSIEAGLIPRGARTRIVSWAGASASAANAQEALDGLSRTLSLPDARDWESAANQPGESIKNMKATLCADPEAKGGAYEIDDVPVPINNPHHAPMTLSGMDFTSGGTAFVSTLVGDIWRIDGLTGDLTNVAWKRIASGLDQPMGLVVKDGAIHVLARNHLFRLADTNGDGAIDRFTRVTRMPLPADSSGRDLRLDAAGNFVFNSSSGVFRLASDGANLDAIGLNSRNPLGLGIRRDGLVLSDSSEGNLGNGTCSIFESDHPENHHSNAKRKRLIYLPRGIDNSPGSRLFLDDARFGPLGNSILGVSYGTGSWYILLRDVVDGTPQAALVPQRGLFTSGACRVAVNPDDGSVFVAGLDGWGDYAVAEGSLHRIRHTGRGLTIPVSWRAHRNGILIGFNTMLAREPVLAERVFVQQWNYVDSQTAYGSPEFSVRSPGQIGHDRLLVRRVIVQPDRKSLFLDIPGLLPSMCSQVRATMVDSAGGRFELDFYPALQRLATDHPCAPPSDPGKPHALVVPESNDSGDTYQQLTGYFDRLAGRDPAKRPVAPDIPHPPAAPDFAWIRTNLIERHCLPCHGPGTPHDFTTYQGLTLRLKPGHPAGSALDGMIRTGSMPPYPLPTVPPNLRQAVSRWIMDGAPE